VHGLGLADAVHARHGLQRWLGACRGVARGNRYKGLLAESRAMQKVLPVTKKSVAHAKNCRL
jgi:hypothetical protein